MATESADPQVHRQAVGARPGLVQQGRIEEATLELLRALGEDVSRDGLADTPRRVAKAWAELTEGYHLDPEEILATTFDVGKYDQLVLCRGIPYFSFCEHHLLPFFGTATIGYIPADRVLGLSKMPRVLHLFARRLQVQERLTREVADAIEGALAPAGVGVVVRGVHTCMVGRGVRLSGAEMLTSDLRGALRNGAARAEFMSLAEGGA